MSMQRELRWLYRALLKSDGQLVDIREIIGMYSRYNAFRKEIQESNIAPGTLKNSLPPVKMPKYLDWVSQYVVYTKE